MNTTCCFFRFTIVLVAILSAAGGASAAHFTTTVQQAGGAHWSQAIWQPGAVTPAAGNTYECLAGAPSRLRNPPTAGIQTFPGDSLQLNTNSEIRAKQAGAILDFPGVVGSPGLILNGGNMDAGDNTIFSLTGVIVIQSPSSFTCGDSGGNNSRGWLIGAEIRGSASIDVSKYFGGGANAIELTGVNNSFTGTWIFRSGGFKATGSGSLGNSSIVLSPTNGTVNPVVLEVMYDVNSSGSLTITNGGRMILHQNCAWSGVIINGTSLSIGTHPFSELEVSFPGVFTAGGSGSIAVTPPAPPSAPSNVAAAAGDAQVSLSWSPAVNASGYNIFRSSDSGGPYTLIGTTGANGFVDSPLVNGATYYYVIAATNSLGSSTNSLEVVAIPNVVVVGVTATGGTNQVEVSWMALANAESYSVLRSSSAAGPFSAVASGLAGRSYLDTTAQSGSTYFYRISAALIGGGVSGQSATVSATTAPTAAPVLTSTLFAATVIRVGWMAVPGAAQYLLERSTDGINFSLLATLSQASYTNSGLAVSNTYYYRAQATNAGGASPHSNVASSMTPVFGINVNFSQGFAPIPPVPPGYLQDTGGIFTLQSSGFSFGWDRNIGVDGRYRATAIAADLRYDTFMHLMKILPSAIWEIELPNGPYEVHIVSIDTGGAVDSTYQFNIEGVITTSAASVAFQASEFTNTCVVTDGRLTLTSGPSAVNNKIAFIDIYAFAPLPPIISAPPQNQTVEQGRPISLSVSFGQGSTPLVYQWYYNNDPISDGTNATVNFPHVQPANQGDYFLVVTNYAGAATSSVATITVTPDTVPPYIISAGSVDGLTIGICFNEELDTIAPNAHDPSNYSVNEGANTVTNAIVSLDGRSVLLQFEGTVTNGYAVAAFSMPDYAINLGDSSTNGLILGFAAQDIGGPLRPGSNFTCDNETIEIIGGGVDYWGTADQAYIVTTNVSGNFDARVQVTSLRGSNAIAKGLLIARETTNADSAGIHISVNPPTGRNQVEMGIRSVLAGATAGVGTNFVPAGVPNAWMRLTRVGNLFTGYRSSNGVDWVQLGQTNQVFAENLAVGFGVSAHDTNLWATGTFKNFAVGSPFPGTFPQIVAAQFTAGVFSASFTSTNGTIYEVQYSHSIAISKPCIGFEACPDPPVQEPWFTLTNIVGDGALKTFIDSAPAVDRRFYRLLLH